MKMVIKRTSYNEDGTFGLFYIDGVFHSYTLEPEDKNNQKDISCIPKGVYTCKRVRSPKFGNTFMVMDVPNRSAILFHAGGTEEHTKGCILLGDVVGHDEKNNKIGVFGSNMAVKRFLDKTARVNEFELTITE